MKTPFQVNNRPFFILGGQVHNSSGYGPASLERTWPALTALHANTAEVPVYWDQVEPREGEFTFAHLDGILEAAREHHIRLVLLWFATWKNGSMQYAPEWVKSSPGRFQPVLTAAGNALWVLSSHCEATWQADCNAYCRLLAHLHEVDGDQHTVIGVQIENEPGILGSPRDYSDMAEQEFQQPVPGKLLEKVQQANGSPIRAAWEQAGCAPSGNWERVFGRAGEEYFSAWSVARYIDRLAEAGRAIYDLPMYVNVWLGENSWQIAGASYPSGGPASQVLDIWKWATPHIDLIAPDIYLETSEGYQSVCQSYQRDDNPLFIPESGGGISNALNLFEAIARYDTVGYAVFGVESLLDASGVVKPEARPLVDSFRCVSAALPLIEEYLGSGKIYAVVQREFANDQHFDFGDMLGMARFDSTGGHVYRDYDHLPANPVQRARGLIIMPNAHEFYLVGVGYRLLLKPKLSGRQEFSRPHDQFDSALTHYSHVEEGHFSPDGDWVIDRMRNGDEITSGLWVASDVGVVHAVLTD